MSPLHWQSKAKSQSKVLGLAAAVMAVAVGPAQAEIYPNIHGELSLEIENDLTFESDDPTAELNDLFATAELGATLSLTPAFSLNWAFLIEPVLDPVDDREFEDNGFFVQEIFLRYDFGVVAAFAGKFNPTFGTAWDLTPGIYGADFAEDYELTERIGGGLEFPFTAGGTAHALTVNTFFQDVTVLSNSLGTQRGETDKADGGASNTANFSSFSATLDGGVPTTPLNYHLGLRYQEGGVGDPGDDFGAVAGLNATWALSDDSGISAIGEVAYFDEQDGGTGEAIYATVGGLYGWRAWTASASYTFRELDDGFDPDHLVQGSIGYGFDFGLGVEVGYKFAQEAEVESHTVGALVTYAVEF